MPTEEFQELRSKLKTIDLGPIGPAIKYLPPAQWQDHMLFSGAPDKSLKEETGSFPAILKEDKTTHPIFVLKTLGNLGHEVCPCTSKEPWDCSVNYVKEGCVLEITRITTDKKSYILEHFSFTLPNDMKFRKRLWFKGRVPVECLGKVSKQGTGE